MISVDDDTERDVEHGTLAEQLDESYYDNRRDADDDLEKGRIRFPPNRLYGREKELMELRNEFSLLSCDKNDSTRVVFLGGYSGTGKSSLVDEFIKQVSAEKSNFKNLQFISGKFSQMSAGDPFSAIAQAMNQFVLSLTHEPTPDRLRRVKKRLAKFGISLGSDYFGVLQATLIQDLQRLLLMSSTLPVETQGYLSKAASEKPKQSSVGQDLNMIKHVFQNFVKAFTEDDPVIMFIDDLQWADDASLQLLLGLLKDKSVSRLFFIGSYRANEVDEGHKLTNIMKELENDTGPRRAKKIEISNLSPNSIAEFIADSIERTVEEVAAISDVVYSKTLGNIFFVKLALEELVRKNAIYFDVVCFQWLFGDVSRVELEKFLSDDVVEMVLSKLRALPKLLQKSLSLAAYSNDTIELGLLMDLLKAAGSETDQQTLVQMMELAFVEGLVLRAGRKVPLGSGEAYGYKFAHDRIREAACASISAGDERDQLLIIISKVLMERGSSQTDDWMLFKAASNLNSVDPSRTDQSKLAELNLRVANMASSKGAFNETAVFLRAGVRCLDPSVCWRDNYTLCLELKSKLTEVESYLGNNDKVLELADEIFGNAKLLTDKSRAQFCYIESLNAKNNMDYAKSAETALDFLEMYGVCIPKKPTRLQLEAEKIRVKAALWGRSILYLTEVPIASDPRLIATIKIASIALRFSSYASNTDLTDMVGHHMLRFAFSNQVITKEMIFILCIMAASYRRKGKYRKAIGLISVATTVLERFADEKGKEFLISKVIVTSSTCVYQPFRDSVDTLWDLKKLLLVKGESNYGLVAAMNGMFGYLAASLFLNVLLESKLFKLEESANNVGKANFAVIFRLLRQCLYNFQGGSKASSNPVEVKGAAYEEDKVLASLQGGARKMTNRDISVIRLMLAVFFNDEACMDEMLDRLDEYPTFDLSFQRQYLRMTYTGFAALMLAKKFDKHKKWAKTSFEFFRQLARSGSENAQPVFLCMKALDKPSFNLYDDAIQICGNAGLINLAALMNEKCGMMLLQDSHCKRGELSGEDYLKCAFWLYHDWGAMSKVSELQSRYEFLSSAMHEKAPSKLSDFRHTFARLMPSTVDHLSEIRSGISGVSGMSG